MSDVTDLNLSPADALKMFEEQSQIDAQVASDDKEKQAAAEAAAQAQAAADAEKKAAEAAAAEAAKQDANAKQTQEQEAAREPDPTGVATRDGKHVIPYSVLASERAARAAAEKQLQEFQERIAALESKQAGQNQAANTGATADTPASEDEQDRLALLAEDFPTVAAELKAMREHVKSLQAQLKPLEQSNKQAQQERANSVAMTVQEAIDSLPKMAHIQASDPDTFAMAINFDKTLRERPEWADKPMKERFEKVLALVEAANGEIQVPGHKTPSADPKALKEAAAAKLANAEKTVPTSLSQFPSGEPAATSEHQAIEQMSAQQLAQKMAKMTPAQLESYFANL